MAGGETKVVELHFESILGQSRAAMKCFASWVNPMMYGESFKISYAPDPCDKSLLRAKSSIVWQRN